MTFCLDSQKNHPAPPILNLFFKQCEEFHRLTFLRRVMSLKNTTPCKSRTFPLALPRWNCVKRISWVYRGGDDSRCTANNFRSPTQPLSSAALVSCSYAYARYAWLVSRGYVILFTNVNVKKRYWKYLFVFENIGEWKNTHVEFMLRIQQFHFIKYKGENSGLFIIFKTHFRKRKSALKFHILGGFTRKSLWQFIELYNFL